MKKVPGHMVKAIRKILDIPYNTVRNWSLYGIPKEREDEVIPEIDRLEKREKDASRVRDLVDSATAVDYWAEYDDRGVNIHFKSRAKSVPTHVRFNYSDPDIMVKGKTHLMSTKIQKLAARNKNRGKK